MSSIEGIVWPNQTLDQLEGVEWDEPDHPWSVAVGEARRKPLRDFTPEDLRFMLGQHMCLSVLMPMALDVLELVDPFVGGNMNHGTLLLNALRVDKQFWQDNPTLWIRMNGVLIDLYSFRKLIEEQLLPAAEAFKAMRPESEQSPDANLPSNRD